MYYVHPYTISELQYLQNAYQQDAPGPRPRRQRRRRATWRQRVHGMLRERPQLTVFTVDADDVTAQLAGGAK